MRSCFSRKDILPSVIMLGALTFYFDSLTAIILYVVTAFGVIAVRKSIRTKRIE
jgi:hypothetical protein